MLTRSGVLYSVVQAQDFCQAPQFLGQHPTWMRRVGLTESISWSNTSPALAAILLLLLPRLATRAGTRV